nr:M36 family metallopeptidase [Pyrinomonadaceae bacterium]
GNFQHFNFGRGGSEGDRISFEVQDGSGTNGANFSTPADGGRGLMQNFRWTLATPGRDGTLDSTVVVHELTHGTSNRLHGNTTGLSTNMARGMGEGWSDFYAAALLSEPADAACGVYAVGGYISHNFTAGYANSYYGLRRFPLARIGCLGANGLPFNPLTFRNLNAGSCATFDAAFPRGMLGSATCDQVHNAGEIWSSALWEVRGRLIDIHGAVEGNRRVLQYVTDAMKLAPLNPNFLQARDAVITAAAAIDAGDVVLVREGFRRRGMGFSASIQTTTPASVTEAFDFAPGALRSPFDFDGDGRTDISVYRPSEGNWYLQRSTQGFAALNWGIATDKLVPADYDNDGKTDLAVFRKGENSTWYILNSASSTVRVAQWGASNIEQAILFDTPVPADYDGDGKADLAVWRLTDFISEPARYLIQQSSNGQSRVAQWGSSGDIPVPADFDGDRRADLAIYRGAAPGGAQWWVQKSLSGQVQVTQFGLGSDKAVPADYTGDALADIAVWRPSTGEWFILRSLNNSYFAFPFGTNGDLPVPGDYDGDGRVDAAIFRPSNSTWFAQRSTAGILIQQFGATGDVPVPNAFVRQ